MIKAVLNGESKAVEFTGPNLYAAKVLEFVMETVEEFSYDDFKRWLEGKEGYSTLVNGRAGSGG